jgi:hypothetical protein
MDRSPQPVSLVVPQLPRRLWVPFVPQSQGPPIHGFPLQTARLESPTLPDLEIEMLETKLRTLESENRRRVDNLLTIQRQLLGENRLSMELLDPPQSPNPQQPEHKGDVASSREKTGLRPLAIHDLVELLNEGEVLPKTETQQGRVLAYLMGRQPERVQRAELLEKCEVSNSRALTQIVKKINDRFERYVICDNLDQNGYGIIGKPR